MQIKAKNILLLRMLSYFECIFIISCNFKLCIILGIIIHNSNNIVLFLSILRS